MSKKERKKKVGGHPTSGQLSTKGPHDYYNRTNDTLPPLQNWSPNSCGVNSSQPQLMCVFPKFFFFFFALMLKWRPFCFKGKWALCITSTDNTRIRRCEKVCVLS